jgi:hypothetical protein
MGTVLEMKMRNQFIGVLAAFGLMSCGPLAEGGIATQLVEIGSGIVNPKPVAAPPPAVASQEDILANPGKFLRVNIRDLDRWDTMVAAGSNADRVTWVDSANISITVENGVLVATRGLPRDLMGSDVSQVWSALQAGGGVARRHHEFIDDQDNISARQLECNVALKGPEVLERLGQKVETMRFEEQCRAEELGFTNIYWLGRSGAIVRSLQAVSPDAGYLQIDVF